jgi:hypothetical protein
MVQQEGSLEQGAEGAEGAVETRTTGRGGGGIGGGVGMWVERPGRGTVLKEPLFEIGLREDHSL